MPEDVTGHELDREVRGELSSLNKEVAREVGRHLVMAGRLLDDEPELAYEHAIAARGRAARIAVVREATGFAAYRTGRFAEALAELRTVRRLTGSQQHLPVMADCERGLGRPERTLALAASEEARNLDIAERIELLIVVAGARTDLGDQQAAVVTLQIPELQAKSNAPWVARLRSAYADALLAVGRSDEGREWLQRAADADEYGETGAGDRLDELDGLVYLEVDGDEVGDEPESPAAPETSLGQ